MKMKEIIIKNRNKKLGKIQVYNRLNSRKEMDQGKS